jgi:hypothetical protein
MWRTMPRLATATLTITMALAVSTTAEIEAATVNPNTPASTYSYSYTTDGSISGMTGRQPIEFYSLSSTINATTPFSIGLFVTNPLPATARLTYDNTPFVIDLKVPTSTGSAYDYNIAGVLNGSINGVGKSNMYVYITSITGIGDTPPFPVSELQINAPQKIAAPSGENDGFTTLTGQLVIPGLPPPLGAPEPASIVVFGTALAGWLVHRRRSRSKAGL